MAWTLWGVPVFLFPFCLPCRKPLDVIKEGIYGSLISFLCLPIISFIMSRGWIVPKRMKVWMVVKKKHGSLVALEISVGFGKVLGEKAQVWGLISWSEGILPARVPAAGLLRFGRSALLAGALGRESPWLSSPPLSWAQRTDQYQTLSAEVENHVRKTDFCAHMRPGSLTLPGN